MLTGWGSQRQESRAFLGSLKGSWPGRSGRQPVGSQLKPALFLGIWASPCLLLVPLTASKAGGPGAHGLYLGSPRGPQKSPSSSSLRVPIGRPSAAGSCGSHIPLPLETASSREESRIWGVGLHSGRQMTPRSPGAPGGAGPPQEPWELRVTESQGHSAQYNIRINTFSCETHALHKIMKIMGTIDFLKPGPVKTQISYCSQSPLPPPLRSDPVQHRGTERKARGPGHR